MKSYGFSSPPTFKLTQRSSVSFGPVGNANSSGGYNRLTGEYFFGKPFRLDRLYWDINIAQTYYIQQVNNLTNAPTVLRLIQGPVSLAGAAEAYIPVTPPLYIPAGMIYLSLYCSTSVSMRRYSTGTPRPYLPYCINTDITYNGGSSGTGSMPIRLVGTYWDIQRS